jgi:hypothetical protein
MNKAGLDSIEKYIGLPLPDDYKQVLWSYPKILVSLKSHDVSPATNQLYNKANKILQVNKHVRSEDFLMVNKNDNFERWKNHFLVIGDNVATGYFAINLKNKRTIVYIRDYSYTKMERHAGSLKEHIRKIFDTYYDWSIDNLGL